MTDELRAKAGVSERAHHAGDGTPAAPRKRRMSAQRKQEAVLRLFRGEDLELMSRELGVTAADLSGWRDSFLTAGAVSLKSRPEDDRDRQLRAMKEKIGDLTMANELLEAKIERMETGTLLRGGGRGDEPDGLALREAGLRPGPGLPELAPQLGHGLSPPPRCQPAEGTAPPAGTSPIPALAPAPAAAS